MSGEPGNLENPGKVREWDFDLEKSGKSQGIWPFFKSQGKCKKSQGKWVKTWNLISFQPGKTWNGI